MPAHISNGNCSGFVFPFFSVTKLIIINYQVNFTEKKKRQLQRERFVISSYFTSYACSTCSILLIFNFYKKCLY